MVFRWSIDVVLALAAVCCAAIFFFSNNAYRSGASSERYEVRYSVLLSEDYDSLDVMFHCMSNVDACDPDLVDHYNELYSPELISEMMDIRRKSLTFSVLYDALRETRIRLMGGGLLAGSPPSLLQVGLMCEQHHLALVAITGGYSRNLCVVAALKEPGWLVVSFYDAVGLNEMPIRS